MPKFIKNAMNQIIFPMVDKTDFASIESGITASDFNSAATKKFYGVDHGGSAAYTSGTISKAATLVTSGIFQQTLKATECNYDYIAYVFRHASCADQILIFQTEELDLSDAISDLKSYLAGRSQVSDLVSDLRSYLVGMSGALSDVESQIDLNASLASDAHSAAAQANSRALVIISNLSDVESALDSQFAYLSGAISDAHSDLYSAIGNVSVTLTASDISDIASATAAAITTVGPSEISDIASRVYAVLFSDLSDILSAAQQGNSRVLVVQSMVSDVESQVDLNASMISDVQSALDSQFTAGHPLNASDLSDLRSAITAAGVTASNISDIASAVLVILTSDLSDIYSAAQQTNSRALVIQSRVSDVYSLLSDVESQLDLNASNISDVQSALDSQFAYLSNALSNMSGVVSDVYSNLAAGVTVGASSLSDLYSRMWDTAEAEITATPSAAAGYGDKLAWLFALARNKRTTTSALETLRNDDDTSTIASAAVSDDGSTFTRGEWA